MQPQSGSGPSARQPRLWNVEEVRPTAATQDLPALSARPVSDSSCCSTAPPSDLGHFSERGRPPMLVPRLNNRGPNRGPISKPRSDFTKARILKDPPDYRPVFDKPEEAGMTARPSLLTACASPPDWGRKGASMEPGAHSGKTLSTLADTSPSRRRPQPLVVASEGVGASAQHAVADADSEVLQGSCLRQDIDVPDLAAAMRGAGTEAATERLAEAMRESQQAAIDGLSGELKSYLEALESRLTVQYVVLGERVQGCQDLLTELKERPAPEALQRQGSEPRDAEAPAGVDAAGLRSETQTRLNQRRNAICLPPGETFQREHSVTFKTSARGMKSLRTCSDQCGGTASFAQTVMRNARSSACSSEVWEEFDGRLSARDTASDALEVHTGRVVRCLTACKDRVIGCMRGVVGDPVPGSVLHTVSQDERFNAFGILMTLGNCVLVAIDTDLATNGALQVATGGVMPHDANADIAFMLQKIFLGWFAFEVVVQLLGTRIAFFIGPDRWWNALDVGILGASLFALLGSPLTTSYVRALRIARASRAMRAARFIRCSDSLRRITGSISSVMLSLFWTACLMLIIVYVIGIMMMEGVSNSLDSLDGLLADEVRVQGFVGYGGLDLFQSLQNYYGGMGRMSFTLFRAITGGDWGVFAAPLAALNTSWDWVWLAYIFVVVFGAANIVTGLVVNIIRQPLVTDRAVQAAAEAADERALSDLFVSELARVGMYNDEAVLSKTTFEHIVSRPYVARRMALLGVDMEQIEDAYLLVDLEGTGKVPPHLAARRVLHLRGSAKSEDVTRMAREVQRIKSDIYSLVNTISELRTHVCELVLRENEGGAKHFKM